jgi:pyridoxine kinase
VTEATAAAVRDELLPLATVATPNLFELTWMTGLACAGPSDAVNAARRLGAQAVAVTSAVDTPENVSTLLVTALDAVEYPSPRHHGIPNGAGDLFAGLFLAHLLNEPDEKTALVACLSDLDRVLAASAGRAVLELSALNRVRLDRGA